MELYYRKFNDISKFYKLYIPNFQDTTKKTKKVADKTDVKSKQLEKIEPTLFIKGRYIRNMCQEYPLNIDKDYDNYTEHIEKGKPLDPDNIYKKFIDEKKDILVFPKKEIKGYSPRRYICDTEKNRKLKKIYPGMKENKMKNKTIFKYLPCCFKTRQNTALKLRSLRKKDPSILNLFKFEGGEKDYDDLEEEEEVIMDEELMIETLTYKLEDFIRFKGNPKPEITNFLNQIIIKVKELLSHDPSGYVHLNERIRTLIKQTQQYDIERIEIP
jgi:hypothetical protein